MPTTTHEPIVKSAIDLIIHQQFPDVADALRARIEKIVTTWMSVVRAVVPTASAISESDLRDHQPAIMSKMADVLALANREDVDELLAAAPSQGLARFRQRYNVRELMTEDRLLRRVIIQQVESELSRRMDQDEQLALDMSIDTMLQEAVVAFIIQQNDQLRVAAEAELKYLSFLSHDMNNNLNLVTLMLQLLRQRLASSVEFAEDVETLDAAQQSILDTIGGMGRLLQSERLRKARVQVEHRPVRLHQIASNAVRSLAKKDEAKGLTVDIQISKDLVITNDGELIGIVMQNLLGNAVKYSSKGTIAIRAAVDPSECVLSVSDEGPGIAAEHLERIFEAFKRGDVHTQAGIGLGLTIASQAAKLLKGELSVNSTVGVGSTFTLRLPLLP